LQSIVHGRRVDPFRQRDDFPFQFRPVFPPDRAYGRGDEERQPPEPRRPDGPEHMDNLSKVAVVEMCLDLCEFFARRKIQNSIRLITCSEFR